MPNPNVTQAVREALEDAAKWMAEHDVQYRAPVRARAKIAAALAMLSADCVIVPREPTEAMLRAAERTPVPKVANVLRSGQELAAAIYRAMLAAAQDGGQ